jgi:deazaflavin-dependent oxidoreductase (nitroreductase family)
VPLAYFTDGPGRIFVWASAMAAPAHPDWYINLVANERVTVELRTSEGRVEHFDGTAVTVTGAERDRLFGILSGIRPDAAAHQEQTNREIPLVVISLSEVSVEQVAAFAIEAHGTQVDLNGVSYSEHLRAVADGVEPFGARLQMAGWLHDILEDVEFMTTDGLRAAGIPDRVVEIVELLTRTLERSGYLDMIREVAQDPEATLVKIADNAHNSRPDRNAAIPDEARRLRLAGRYRQARRILWPAASVEDVTTIVERVNPGLLDEL